MVRSGHFLRVKVFAIGVISAAFIASHTSLSGLYDARSDQPKVVESLEDCNVIWDTPGGSSFNSMPLGNGDVGLNVWVENNGDIVFYISKVDAFDSQHCLPKLGRVRVKSEPPPDLTNFRQTLVLRDAAVGIKAGDVKARIWVDANAPVVRVQYQSAVPRMVRLMFESLRPMQSATNPLPSSGTVGLLFEDQHDRIAWCYRNQSSVWAANLASQNTPEMVARVKP